MDLVVAHITGADAGALIPSLIALFLTGVGVGIYTAPRLVRRLTRRGGES